MMAALIVGAVALWVASYLCFRMSRLYARLAFAHQLIAELIAEDDGERRVLLALANRV